MISKFNHCYRKYLNPKELFYIKLLSNCPYFIYVLLSYTVKGKMVSKQSPVFRRDEFQLLTFPSDAIQITFTIFNCKYNPPRNIYTKTIPSHKSTCYKIIGSNIGHVTSVEIPC